MKRRGILLTSAVAAVLAIMLAGCGGGNSAALFQSPQVTNLPATAPPPPSTALSVTPASLVSRVSDTWTLQAGAPVNWTVREGAAGGTITAAGVYTAPATIGTYHIVATSVSDSSLSATVPVTVLAHGFVVAGGIPVRGANTATLLPGGDVLLVGGLKLWESSVGDAFCPDVYVRESTIFDATTSSFNQGAATMEPRTWHSAALLPDGKVLIAGGSLELGCTSTPVNTAEVFDSSAGSFFATGAMADARSGSTATLLPNGKVLVAGGFVSLNVEQSSAELYDPSAGSFSPTGSLNTGRALHTATLLPNGKVLILGGYRSVAPWMATPAELYDPASGTFTVAATISPRVAFTATLLPDGTILIAGGTDGKGTIYDTLERFDPATGTMTPVGKMLAPRAEHTATLLPSGAVLIAGGVNYNKYPTWSSPMALAEVYDPHSMASSPVAPLHSPRAGHNGTVLGDGSVLITDGAVGVAELFK